jgi:hypothetical protein
MFLWFLVKKGENISDIKQVAAILPCIGLVGIVPYIDPHSADINGDMAASCLR